jgi:hypothetical protein
VFKEDVAGRLLRVDTDAVVRDDGRRCGINFELLGSEFEDISERSRFWYAQSNKWETIIQVLKNRCIF